MRVLCLSCRFSLALICVGLVGHASNRVVAEETGPAQLREVIVSYAQGNGKMQLYRVLEDGSLAVTERDRRGYALSRGRPARSLLARPRP